MRLWVAFILMFAATAPAAPEVAASCCVSDCDCSMPDCGEIAPAPEFPSAVLSAAPLKQEFPDTEWSHVVIPGTPSPGARQRINPSSFHPPPAYVLGSESSRSPPIA